MGFLLLFGILVMGYGLLVAKRMTALARSFRWQSLFLALFTFASARREGGIDLYIVAALILIIKVVLIPYFLFKIIKKINVGDNMGLFINPQLSVVFGLVFTYASWMFCRNFIPSGDPLQALSVTASFTLVFIGMFIMISRMKALTQTIGLLVIENGLFLLASSIAGGMPFFVEIAIFFDVFISVIILNIFMQRINKLFTHIDVHKLTQLRG